MTLIFHFDFYHSRTTFQPRAFPLQLSSDCFCADDPSCFLLLASCFIRDLIWVHRICMQAPMCACMICTYMGPARVTAFQHGINTRQKPPVARALMNRPEERTSSTPEARGRSFLSFFTYDCFPVLLFSTLFFYSLLFSF